MADSAQCRCGLSEGSRGRGHTPQASVPHHTACLAARRPPRTRARTWVPPPPPPCPGFWKPLLSASSGRRQRRPTLLGAPDAQRGRILPPNPEERAVTSCAARQVGKVVQRRLSGSGPEAATCGSASTTPTPRCSSHAWPQSPGRPWKKPGPSRPPGVDRLATLRAPGESRAGP